MKKLYLIYITFLLVGCKSYKLNSSNGITVPVSSSKSIDSTLIREVLPYKKVLDSSMNEVIGVSILEMSTGSPEGILGNFVSDLCLEIGNQLYKRESGKTADFVLLNNGGLRTFMPKGDVTRRKIFEIMPFENELVVVTLSAEKINELFAYVNRRTVKDGNRKQGVPVSGNVKVILNKSDIQSVTIDELPLKSKEYRVITSDYLANGGDDMKFFLNPISLEKVGVKLRDAILDYIIHETKEGKNIEAELDKRISYVN